jgi:hypothetical protein
MDRCALSKGDSLCCQYKENTFPFLFLGYIDFFVFFNKFEKRIKECYVTKAESSVAKILVPSAQNTGMLRAKGHMKEKDTREKSSGGQRCQDTEAK